MGIECLSGSQVCYLVGASVSSCLSLFDQLKNKRIDINIFTFSCVCYERSPVISCKLSWNNALSLYFVCRGFVLRRTQFHIIEATDQYHCQNSIPDIPTDKPIDLPSQRCCHSIWKLKVLGQNRLGSSYHNCLTFSFESLIQLEAGVRGWKLKEKKHLR